MIRVLLAVAFLEDHGPWLQEQLGSEALIESADWDKFDVFLAKVPEADVVVSYRWNAVAGAQALNLRLLQNSGAGMDRIDIDAVPSRAFVANCYEHERAVAEYVVMACLALSRNLLQADRNLRQGNWSASPTYGHEFYSELADRRIGIIGFGRIGREVARLLRPFDVRLSAIGRNKPSIEDESTFGLEWSGDGRGLDRLLQESDFVVMAVPLNVRTTGMVSKRELGLMRPEAFLINPSRADVVSGADLFDALRGGRIAGAALDPWWKYPAGPEPQLPSEQAFWDLPNVIMTPHFAGQTAQTLQRRMKIISRNIRCLIEGRELTNVVREPRRL